MITDYKLIICHTNEIMLLPKIVRNMLLIYRIAAKSLFHAISLGLIANKRKVSDLVGSQLRITTIQ